LSSPKTLTKRGRRRPIPTPTLISGLAVLEWVLGLQDGPPVEGVFDPDRETFFAQVGETGVWIEYLVLPDLDPPAIVIRRYR